MRVIFGVMLSAVIATTALLAGIGIGVSSDVESRLSVYESEAKLDSKASLIEDDLAVFLGTADMATIVAVRLQRNNL